MYVRTTRRKDDSGRYIEYVQLAQSYRDPITRKPKTHIVCPLGRKDQLDLDGIKRLISGLARLLPARDATEMEALALGNGELRFEGSRPMGGAHLLRQLWERIGIDEILASLLKDRDIAFPVDWALFAMVANRALEPSSKLAAEDWARNDVFLGKEELDLQVHHFYRAMDLLLEHREALERQVFNKVANLFNLQVDLVFFDTTSTYFEIEDPDDLRAYGHSKDKRFDLPQVVIGLAVTKEGIPVKSWIFPGNTADVTTVPEVQRDLAGWRIGRLVWVMDRGMTSEENKKVLQKAGGAYILGEKLRKDQEALRSGGRYRKVSDNLHVKEVIVREGSREERFIIAFNPHEAERDLARREQVIERLQKEIEALEGLKKMARDKAICALTSHPILKRYLKVRANGSFSIDKARIRAEEKLDGKYLISTNDTSLSSDEVALGYKQLLEVEAAFRSLKTTLELRPIYHRKEERIQSHVLLCWLALLLIRLTEVNLGNGWTWPRIRTVMDRLHLGTFLMKKNRVLQRTELTSEQRIILKKLKISPPSNVIKFENPSSKT